MSVVDSLLEEFNCSDNANHTDKRSDVVEVDEFMVLPTPLIEASAGILDNGMPFISVSSTENLKEKRPRIRVTEATGITTRVVATVELKRVLTAVQSQSQQRSTEPHQLDSRTHLQASVQPQLQQQQQQQQSQSQLSGQQPQSQQQAHTVVTNAPPTQKMRRKKTIEINPLGDSDSKVEGTVTPTKTLRSSDSSPLKRKTTSSPTTRKTGKDESPKKTKPRGLSPMPTMPSVDENGKPLERVRRRHKVSKVPKEKIVRDKGKDVDGSENELGNDD